MFSAIYVGRQLGDVAPETLALYYQFADQICATAGGLAPEQALTLLCSKYPQYALFQICDNLTSSVPRVTLLRSNSTGFLLQTRAIASDAVFLGSVSNQNVSFPSFSSPNLPANASALTFASTKAIQFTVPGSVGVVEADFPQACVAPLLLVGVDAPPLVKVTSASPPTLAINTTVVGIPAVQNGSLGMVDLLNYGANNPSQTALFATQQAHLENFSANSQRTILLLCTVTPANTYADLGVVVRMWARPSADSSLTSITSPDQPPGSTSVTNGRVTQYTILPRDSVNHIVPRYNGTQQVTIQIGEDSVVDVSIFFFPDETSSTASLNGDSRRTSFELKGFQSAQIRMANPQFTKASLVTVRTEDIEPSTATAVGLGVGLGLGLGALVCLAIGGVFLWRYKKKKREAQMGMLPDPERDGLRTTNSYRGINEIGGYGRGSASSKDPKSLDAQKVLTTSADEAYNQNVQLSVADLGAFQTAELTPLPNPLNKTQD